MSTLIIHYRAFALQHLHNDILKIFRAPCLVYADELKLYSQVENISHYLAFHSDLDKIPQWSLMNNVSIMVPKCNVVSFPLKEKENIYNKKRIWGSDTFRNLGVHR